MFNVLFPGYIRKLFLFTFKLSITRFFLFVCLFSSQSDEGGNSSSLSASIDPYREGILITTGLA